MSYTIPEQQVNEALFSFLQSIYLFEQRELDMFGVDWGEVYMMQLLLRQPGMRISELSSRMKVKDFVTSRTVTKLANAGLLQRIASTKDKRVVEVYITDAGKAKIASIEKFNYAAVSANFEHISKEQLLLLMNTIGQLDKLLNLQPNGG